MRISLGIDRERGSLSGRPFSICRGRRGSSCRRSRGTGRGPPLPALSLNLLLKQPVKHPLPRRFRTGPKVEHCFPRYLGDALTPLVLLTQHSLNRRSQFRQIGRVERNPHLVTQRDISRRDAELLPIRIAHLHGRIDENAGFMRCECELIGDRGPISDHDIGSEYRFIGREIFLKNQLLCRYIRISHQYRLPAGAIAFHILRMRPYDNAPSVAQKLLKHLIDA